MALTACFGSLPPRRLRTGCVIRSDDMPAAQRPAGRGLSDRLEVAAGQRHQRRPRSDKNSRHDRRIAAPALPAAESALQHARAGACGPASVREVAAGRHADPPVAFRVSRRLRSSWPRQVAVVEPLTPDDDGPAQRHPKRDRPPVFLNVCRVGSGRLSLTSLGGWAGVLGRDCGGQKGTSLSSAGASDSACSGGRASPPAPGFRTLKSVASALKKNFTSLRSSRCHLRPLRR